MVGVSGAVGLSESEPALSRVWRAGSSRQAGVGTGDADGGDAHGEAARPASPHRRGRRLPLRPRGARETRMGTSSSVIEEHDPQPAGGGRWKFYGCTCSMCSRGVTVDIARVVRLEAVVNYVEGGCPLLEGVSQCRYGWGRQ